MSVTPLLRSAATLAIFLLGGVQPSHGQNTNVGLVRHRVDCDHGRSISNALAAGHRSIEFVGTCDEDVVTEGLDRLEIVGFGVPRDRNQLRSLVVNGPTSVRLENFESDNIALTLGVAGQAANVAVNDGVLSVRFGSNMLLAGIDVVGSVRIDHNSWGAILDNDGVASSIVGSVGDQSLQILQHSSGVIQGGTQVVNDSAEDALIVANGSRALMTSGATTISGGLTVARASSFEVRGGTIDSDTLIESHSLYTVRPNGVYVGNVNLTRDSAIVNELADAVSIDGDVVCADFESSYDGVILSSGTFACTGF